MSAAIAQLPPRYLRTPEAARFLGLSGRTLEKHRTYGTGPLYSKLGGRVVYGLDDLQAWVERGARASTVDCHRDLTLQGHKFSLRFDPCFDRSPGRLVGGHRSDRHGVIERNPALAFS